MVIERWPSLSKTVRAAIVEMVAAASDDRSIGRLEGNDTCSPAATR
jgi:hypothetical protein